MKRILSAILSVIMLMGLLPTAALASEGEGAEENPWNGRSAVFVGDSITAGSGTTKIYYEYLKETFGFGSVTPMGVAGSCISNGSDYGDSNSPLINRYKTIPSAAYIQIFMGTNDFGHATPIGAPEDTQSTTFYGALNTIIPYLLEVHKNSKIVFVTPLHRNKQSSGNTSAYDNVSNKSGHTLEDYVDVLKEVCDKYGVTVIDLYTECTLDPTDAETCTIYMPDGLHPNAAGHELIAGIMESHIRAITPPEKALEPETELIYGNKFTSSINQYQQNRASARLNLYLKAGTVITLKDPATFQWSCAKTSSETSNNNLGYFPDSAWTDKETAVVEMSGWVGFVFKYRDETKAFDLSKPLSDYITIETPSAPIITSQPQNTGAAIGERFTFTVEAEGEDLTYQWYYKDASMESFAASAVKGNRYSFEMTDYRVGREYYCVVTNGEGISVRTDTVKAAVPLTVTSHPQSVVAELGERVNISAEASGEGLTYRWYYKDRGGKEFAPSCYTGKTYAVTMADFRHMREVYCVITDAYGNTVTTETATMSRPPMELKLLEEPADVTAKMGEAFSIGIRAQGEWLTYRWYYKDSYMSGFSASSNRGSAYSYSMESYRNGRKVYCVITDAFGNSITTEAVTIKLQTE